MKIHVFNDNKLYDLGREGLIRLRLNRSNDTRLHLATYSNDPPDTITLFSGVPIDIVDIEGTAKLLIPTCPTCNQELPGGKR